MPILDPCAGAIPVYCCNLSGVGGIEYSAGSGINITDHVISNTSPGIQYNAGAGIAIHEGTIYNTLPGIDYAEGTDISINPNNRKISVIHPFTSDAVYTYYSKQGPYDIKYSVDIHDNVATTGARYLDNDTGRPLGIAETHCELGDFDEDNFPICKQVFHGTLPDRGTMFAETNINNDGISSTSASSVIKETESTTTLGPTGMSISYDDNDYGIHQGINFYSDRMIWLSAEDAQPKTIMWQDLFSRLSI